MKKIFTLCAVFAAVISANADTESYKAVTYDGSTYTASADFTGAVIAEGKSIVKFSTPNMDVEAVGGTTAKDVFQDPGTEFAGWKEWNDVKWELKNQGDITFGYIVGTGNPAISFEAEEVLNEGEHTGHYRPKYVLFTPESGSMPVQGLYYKFTPKADGTLKVAVWSNKGNRNTFVVDESQKAPIAYKAEGYINGQNDADGKKRWLTSDEIQAIHDASNQAGNPYVIGAGNQPFWGNVVIEVTAGKSYWIFQDSSQIGFQGYEFTSSAAGITETNTQAVAPKVVKVLKNNRLVIENGAKAFTVGGARLQ